MTPNLRRPLSHAKLAFGVPLVGYVALYLIDGSSAHPSGDGFYSWIYARSLAYDGDLDFTNDYALCGDPFHMGQDRGGGHPDNPFYAGPAIFWTPLLLVVRLVASLFLSSAASAKASCGGFIPQFTILLGPLAGALTVYVGFLASRRIASSGAALVTSLVFAFGSPLFPYSTSVAHYSHVYLACVYALLLLAGMHFWEAPSVRLRSVIVTAVLVAIAAIHRVNAVVCVLLPLGGILASIAKKPRNTVVRAAILCAGVGVGVGLIALQYVWFYRTPFVSPHGPYLLQPDHAHPWLLLFGVHGGFFFWTPLSYLALVGIVLVWRTRRHRPIVLAACAVTLVDVFVASMPLDWDAAWTIGARRLLPLWALFAAFSAPVIERIGQWTRASTRVREVASGGWVAYALLNGAPAATLYRGDRAYPQEVIYGLGQSPFWRWVDEHVGDVALLPAEGVFAWRFGLPSTSYRDALTHRYQRLYRTLSFRDATLDFADPWLKRVSRGFLPAPGGLEVARSEAHLVFCPEWPVATRIVVRAYAKQAATLRVARRTLGGEVPYGSVQIQGDQETHEVMFTVPPGGFDSGLLEWVFRVDEGSAFPRAGVVIQSVTIEDERPLKPLVEPSPEYP